MEGGETLSLPPSQQDAVEQIGLAWSQTSWPVIQLTGEDAPSKQLVAWHAGQAQGLSVYRLPVELLPSQPGELENLARLWQREVYLSPLALYLDAAEAGRPGDAESLPTSGETLRPLSASCAGWRDRSSWQPASRGRACARRP